MMKGRQHLKVMNIVTKYASSIQVDSKQGCKRQSLYIRAISYGSKFKGTKVETYLV